MFYVSYIGAPPTIGFSARAEVAVRARMAVAIRIDFIVFSLKRGGAIPAVAESYEGFFRQVSGSRPRDHFVSERDLGCSNYRAGRHTARPATFGFQGDRQRPPLWQGRIFHAQALISD